MAGPIVIFEDDHFARLYPLTLTRPAFELVCGTRTLGEKLALGLETAGAVGSGGARAGARERSGPQGFRFHMRQYLYPKAGPALPSYADLYRSADRLTFINGRLIFCESIFAGFDLKWTGKYVCGDTVVAANLPSSLAGRLDGYIGRPLEAEVFADLPSKEVDACVVAYPWDLVRWNGKEIANDFARLGDSGPKHRTPPAPGVFLVNPEAVRLAKGVALAPGVVIDATEGPVNLESDVIVMANASLRGPLHVGAGSVIKMGATVYGGTTIGPVSRIGGEVAESIFQGYSNKQHGGFVGHSYVGEWVNLGAGTNTSDLKNNYSAVKVLIEGRPVDSGENFAGLYMGDHSKSGIGTIFNTGTVVGAWCNIYGAGYPPKYVPSFTWGGNSRFAEHRLEAALETARRAMARRGSVLDADDEAILREVEKLTRAERASFLAGQEGL